MGHGRARASAIYTEQLCQAIVEGTSRQLNRDGEDDLNYMVEDRFFDEANNQELEGDKVREARKLEVQFLRSMNVYEKVDLEECFQNTGAKPITVKWVDTVKKDGRYRSRLVAREYNDGQRDGVWAGTPSLESLKLLLAHAASEIFETGQHKKLGALEEDVVITHIDVARAFFNAPVPAEEKIYVALPPEDRQPGEQGKCGLLRRAMYGTRTAAALWQAEVRRTLEGLDYTPSKVDPAVYFNVTKKSVCIVHGDDVVTVSRRKHSQEEGGGAGVGASRHRPGDAEGPQPRGHPSQLRDWLRG